MKIIIATGLMLLAAAGIQAQQPCAHYDTLIAEAKAFENAHKYDLAKAKLKSAETNCLIKAAEVERMREEIAIKMHEEAGLKNDPVRPVQSTAPKNDSVKVKTDSVTSKTIAAFVVNNWDLIHQMTKADSTVFLGDVARLFRVHAAGTIDSLRAFFAFVYLAKSNEKNYWDDVKANREVTAPASFPADRTEPFYLVSLREMDYQYFEGLLNLDYAVKMLPVELARKYRPELTSLRTTMEARRTASLRDYQVADTVKGLPDSRLFARENGDDRNFAWGYSDYSDYKKVVVRYRNLSIPDFSLTTDSVQQLSDTGLFYNVIAAAGNYRYRIGRQIDYSLKQNKVEYNHITYSDSGFKKLMDSTGTAVMDLTPYSSNDFFFSPDGSHFATWSEASELLVTDIGKGAVVQLPKNKPALTESFASDSKKIAYYNSADQVIYITDLASGKILEEIPGGETGIYAIANIDFTGRDRYLKVNNEDTLTLFDIASRKIVRQFSKALVSELVVSPDGQKVLLTCHTQYTWGTKDYKGSIGIVTDTALNVKARLYSDCSNFFFSPNSDYVIGYGQYEVMRWPLDGSGSGSPADPSTATCLSLEEMVQYKCLPLDRWASVTDADLMETGARAFKDLGEGETDPRVRILYYELSAELFHELANENTKNTRWERVPFFDDWYNWVRRRMGYRDFGNQFVQEFGGVREFESYVNSPDSVYPQQLYYAAYGERLLGSLYDSMRIYNRQLIDLTEKEIVLRCRVFARDPDNPTNNDYLTSALRELNKACDSVGWRDLLNGHYPQRLAVYTREVRLLARYFPELPDSFGLKNVYINALAQYAPSFLYICASHPGGNGHLIDSALFYAEKGLALSTDQFDSARFLLVEARAYLLQPEGLDKSLALYRQVRQHYPDFTRQMMLNQLVYLRDAGERRNLALQRVEEFIKKDEK
jgi:WD40 repeat protein